MDLIENAAYTLTIEGYNSEGWGVARLNGRVVFVKDALQGEVCEVRLFKVGKQVILGQAERILKVSPARIPPACPLFGKCGGCNFQHMRYEEELEAKRRRAEDALRRIGGLDISIPVIYGANNTDRYRNKAQFPVAPGEGEPRVGFYRERSHEVIPVASCLLQSAAADQAAGAVRRWMKEHSVSAYDERTGKGLVRHVYVRTNAQGQALICLLVNGEEIPHRKELIALLRESCPSAVGIVLGINLSKSNVILGERYQKLWGQDFLMDTLCGLSFKLSVPTFFQVNREQTERLYSLVREYAGLSGRETVLDLYCGAGTIGLCLADAAKRVIGVEVVPEAVADAKENAERNGITNAEFFCADAGKIKALLEENNIRPDLVIVDPPRKGLRPEAIELLAGLAAPRIVYVSCDPATLARDLKLLVQDGYAVKEARAVDLFPRTSHVECVTLMSRVKE